MDGRESLSSLYRSLVLRLRRGVRIRAQWAWRVVRQSTAIASLPGISIYAGTNVVAAILVGHAWSAHLPLGGGLLIVASAFLAALALFARKMLGVAVHPQNDRLWNLCLGAATTIPGLSLILAGGLQTPVAAVFSMVLTLAATAVVACWNQSPVQHGFERLRRAAGLLLGSQSKEMELMVDSVFEFPGRSNRHPSESAGDMHPIQWMRRAVDNRGAERLEGVMQVDFPAGQSTVTVHVAFCPPFQQTPAFQCRTPAAPEVRVRASVAYPYGARVELKRAGANSAPISIELEFDAQSAMEWSRAA